MAMRNSVINIIYYATLSYANTSILRCTNLAFYIA